MSVYSRIVSLNKSGRYIKLTNSHISEEKKENVSILEIRTRN